MPKSKLFGALAFVRALNKSASYMSVTQAHVSNLFNQHSTALINAYKKW